MPPRLDRSARAPAGPAPLRLRRARASDLELLVAHRRKMWLAIGGRLRAHLDRADPVYRRWVRRELAARHFVGFVVETPDGRPAGSGAIWLVPTQPRPGRLARPRMPYVMSMFTEPEFRGRGVATRIVRAQIRWARDRGYARLFLHASEMGRPIYARLGFAPGNEMRLDLPARGRRRQTG
ncbi:MAG TPA: GNAT family N-acetyltransferase [Thermoplasmata archaeon]|nr:GNAT family N-acetyltransferase [Thermoplasmata archaeon]